MAPITSRSKASNEASSQSYFGKKTTDIKSKTMITKLGDQRKPDINQSLDIGSPKGFKQISKTNIKSQKEVDTSLIPMQEYSMQTIPRKAIKKTLQNPGDMTSASLKRPQFIRESLDLDMEKMLSPGRSKKEVQLKLTLEPNTEHLDKLSMQKKPSTKKLKSAKQVSGKPKNSRKLDLFNRNVWLQNANWYTSRANKMRQSADESQSTFQYRLGSSFQADYLDTSGDFSTMLHLNRTVAIDIRRSRDNLLDNSGYEDPRTSKDLLEASITGEDSPEVSQTLSKHQLAAIIEAGQSHRTHEAHSPYMLNLQKMCKQHVDNSSSSIRQSLRKSKKSSGLNSSRNTLADILKSHQTNTYRSAKEADKTAEGAGLSMQVSQFCVKKKASGSKLIGKKLRLKEGVAALRLNNTATITAESKSFVAADSSKDTSTVRKESQDVDSNLTVGETSVSDLKFAENQKTDQVDDLRHKTPVKIDDKPNFNQKSSSSGKLSNQAILGEKLLKRAGVLHFTNEKRTRDRCYEANLNNSAHLNQDNESTMVFGIDSNDVNKSVEICEHLLENHGLKNGLNYQIGGDPHQSVPDEFPKREPWSLQESPKDDEPERQQVAEALQKILKLNPLARSLISNIRDHFSKRKKDSEFMTTLSYYDFLKCVGKGVYGKVHLGTQVLTGQKVALKAIGKKQLALDVHGKHKIENEIQLSIKASSCRNVTTFFEVVETKDYYFLVFEYASRGDLASLLKKKVVLSEQEVKQIFVDLLNGIEELHKLRIVHRDLKLENVVIMESGKACIADLGVSKLVEPGELLRDSCGTPAFEAPECLDLEKGYLGFQADMWSLGVLLYHMVCGRPPFAADRIEDLYSKIAFSELSFPPDKELSVGLKDLLRRMLQKDPERRLNIAEARTHLWLDNHAEMQVREDDPKLKMKNSRFSTCFIEELGFPKTYLNDSLWQGKFNHATACYRAILTNRTRD